MDFSFTETQLMIKDQIEKFCKKELNYEYVHWMDENVDFPPPELWQKFADLGVFSGGVPVEYGGQGLGSTEAMLGFEHICKASLSVANAIGATVGFGVRFINELGTKKQKDDILPKLAEGKLKFCMALTEPAGGTDILGAISSFAEDKGDRWILNGQKMFITGAHVADYMIVIAKTEKAAKPSRSLSIFLVPGKSKGITLTKVPKISFHHCDSVGIFFDDVEIPKENILGTRGNGWYEMLTVLNPERIGVAMMGVGIMAAVYDYALIYVQQRNAFGGPIGRFQILQHYLADIFCNLECARLLTYKCAWLCDNQKPFHIEATMAKVVAAEGAMHAAIHGAEIMGGYGICREYPMQMYVRDALQIQFSPISNEMSKNVLMQFQGLPKSWSEPRK